MLGCRCPMGHSPAETFVETLDGIFGFYEDSYPDIDRSELDDPRWTKWTDWGNYSDHPSAKFMRLIWQRIASSQKLPQSVKNFLLVDLIRRLVRADVRAEAMVTPAANLDAAKGDAEAAEESSGQDAAWDYETRCPEEFNRRVMQKLIELGEQAQADKLRDDPLQFWTAYRDGWAQANSDAHAWYAAGLEPWEQQLVVAAKTCVVTRVIDPMFARLLQQKDPNLVVEWSREPRAIWIRPDIPQDLGPLPVNVDIEWEDMCVDIAPLLKLFDEVQAVVWIERGCELCSKGVTIMGKWRGHDIELGFRGEPLPPLEYESGPL
jgi:hypothetical protein